MIEHRYQLDVPHRRDRVWAIMNDYNRWTEFAPMVLGVEVVYPGDARGNGLVRRVIYRMPMGRRGSALELISQVVPGRSYTYTMLSRSPENDQTGSVQLEERASQSTRLHFEERYHLADFPWRLVERWIYRFINRKNEESMRCMSDWLSAHPDYPGTDASA